jgi:hypothetical protein
MIIIKELIDSVSVAQRVTFGENPKKMIYKVDSISDDTMPLLYFNGFLSMSWSYLQTGIKNIFVYIRNKLRTYK